MSYIRKEKAVAFLLGEAIRKYPASFAFGLGAAAHEIENMEEAEVAKAKADTLKDMQIKFAMHFGTYTDDSEVKVSEVFKLLSKFAEEMLEVEI